MYSSDAMQKAHGMGISLYKFSSLSGGCMGVDSWARGVSLPQYSPSHGCMAYGYWGEGW